MNVEEAVQQAAETPTDEGLMELLRSLQIHTHNEPEGILCVPCTFAQSFQVVMLLAGAEAAIANLASLAFLAGREHALAGKSLEDLLAELPDDDLPPGYTE